MAGRGERPSQFDQSLPRSGAPLAREFRVFLGGGGAVLAWAPYWGVGDYDGPPPPLDWVREAVSGVRSNFFTADVAETASGGWLVVEIGDGQVAGLPDGVDPVDFHRQLAAYAAALPSG